MLVVGSKIYDRCAVCGSLIQVNKFLFGDLHICLSDEEIIQRDRYADTITDRTTDACAVLEVSERA